MRSGKEVVIIATIKVVALAISLVPCILAGLAAALLESTGVLSLRSGVALALVGGALVSILIRLQSEKRLKQLWNKLFKRSSVRF
jgi:hypothetical protein